MNQYSVIHIKKAIIIFTICDNKNNKERDIKNELFESIN